MIRAQRSRGKEPGAAVAAMPEGRTGGHAAKEGSVDRFMKLVEEAIDASQLSGRRGVGRGTLGTVSGRERVLEEVVGPEDDGGDGAWFDELVRQVADR